MIGTRRGRDPQGVSGATCKVAAGRGPTQRSRNGTTRQRRRPPSPTRRGGAPPWREPGRAGGRSPGGSPARAGRVWHEAHPELPFVFAGSALASASGVGLLDRRSRLASALSGAALLAASAVTRFGIYEAGVASMTDPRYTVVPQRQRLDHGRPARADDT